MLIAFVLITYICWLLYTNENTKPTGLILSILALFFTIILPYTKHYALTSMIKFYLIIITSILLFIATSYSCVKINHILTWLLRINIACLVFSIDNPLLIAALLITALLVPYIHVTDGKALFSQKSIINPSAWIILSTAVLFWFYMYNKDFRTNPRLPMVLASLFIPAAAYFADGRYIEIRAVMLCSLLVFEAVITSLLK